MLIGNHGNFRCWERTAHLLADILPVTLILGIHRNRDIAHECLGTRSRDLKKLSRLVHQLILHVIKLGVLRLHDDLFIRESRQGNRTPVHHPLAAINQSLLEEI